MAFILLYAEGYNKYLALKQWSTFIYRNILKSSCHSNVPYNQPSEQSILQLFLHYTTSVKWLASWMGNLVGREERLHSPKVKEFVTKFYQQTLEYKALG